MEGNWILFSVFWTVEYKSIFNTIKLYIWGLGCVRYYQKHSNRPALALFQWPNMRRLQQSLSATLPSCFETKADMKSSNNQTGQLLPLHIYGSFSQYSLFPPILLLTFTTFWVWFALHIKCFKPKRGTKCQYWLLALASDMKNIENQTDSRY